MFILIYLLSLVAGILIMFFVVKGAVQKANEDLMERTNMLLQGILKQLGGNPENVPSNKQIMLQKELDRLTEKIHNGSISQSFFTEEQKRIETKMIKLKTN